MDPGGVEVSRLPCVLKATLHFLLVPLARGLSNILAIMGTVPVMTGRPVWRRIAKFRGTLFGISFRLAQPAARGAWR